MEARPARVSRVGTIQPPLPPPLPLRLRCTERACEGNGFRKRLYLVSASLLLRALLGALEPSISPITARTVVTAALKRMGCRVDELTLGMLGPRLTQEIQRGLRLFRTPEPQISQCVSRLEEAFRKEGDRHARATGGAAPSLPIEATDANHEVAIWGEDDIVKARNTVRELARRIGFSAVDQVKIATVVSELTRNIVSYAGTGTVRIRTLPGLGGGIEIRATDRGPGIKNLEEIMKGTYVSKTGMGLGLVGSRRVMDEFSITTGTSGTQVSTKKWIRP